MSTYTYPQMPLKASLWYLASKVPPDGPPDRTDVSCSLSPISPTQAIQLASEAASQIAPTHIIRTAIDQSVTDNYVGVPIAILFPVSVYEIPQGTGHTYLALWSHEVGAGFANHHQRIYVYRMIASQLPQPPYFRGWI